MPNPLIEDCSSVFGILRGFAARKTGFASSWQRHREQVLSPLVEVKFNPAPVIAGRRFAVSALYVFRFMAVWLFTLTADRSGDW
ncbi:hypothetical protein QUB70_18580 [Microcoleus sp. A003_D6]|uniref:hypothetical protein n=1 Tax=Microcoleus sp. A003_D6 TaxID=3055266 RepID=UPI002FD0B6AB